MESSSSSCSSSSPSEGRRVEKGEAGGGRGESVPLASISSFQVNNV